MIINIDSVRARAGTDFKFQTSYGAAVDDISGIHLRHSGKANALFGDFSARPVSRLDLMEGGPGALSYKYGGHWAASSAIPTSFVYDLDF